MCFRPPEAVANTVPVDCPECGEQNAPDTTICVFCGAEIPVQEAPDPSAPAAPTANIGFGIPGAPAAGGFGFGAKTESEAPAAKKWGGAPEVDYSAGNQFRNY